MEKFIRNNKWKKTIDDMVIEIDGKSADLIIQKKVYLLFFKCGMWMEGVHTPTRIFTITPSSDHPSAYEPRKILFSFLIFHKASNIIINL